MVARWCLDAASTSHVFQFTVNWGADVVKVGAQNMYSGMLVAPNLDLWDHRAMQGYLGAHRRRPWASRLGFPLILKRFRGRHWDFFGYLWNNNCVFWHACLQVTFFKDSGV